ncbi:MAG: sigma-70 family RNA polymerase sigma factor [Opitutaceae bacterium]|jgi:RNA polymerase sigma-70 factor (ECF subfamily)
MQSAVFQFPAGPPLREEARATYAHASPMNTPPSTLSRLFEMEEGRLLHFAWGLVGRRSVAEDLVQEAFLRLHPLWAEVENPRAWLYRCVRNLALNHLRDHRRETDLDDAGEVVAEHDKLPVEAMGRQEAVGLVRMFLAELPDEDRDLIQLKYNEDLKYQEIAGRTGLNAGTVGYKLHHLLKRLADSLRNAGIEGSRG